VVGVGVKTANILRIIISYYYYTQVSRTENALCRQTSAWKQVLRASLIKGDHGYHRARCINKEVSHLQHSIILNRKTLKKTGECFGVENISILKTESNRSAGYVAKRKKA